MLWPSYSRNLSPCEALATTVKYLCAATFSLTFSLMTLGPSDVNSTASAASGTGQSLALGAALLTGGFLANTVQGAQGKVAQESVAPGQFLWLLIVVALGVLLPVSLWRQNQVMRTDWQVQLLPFYLLRADIGLCGF